MLTGQECAAGVQDLHHLNPNKTLWAGLRDINRCSVRWCPLYLFHHYLLLACISVLCKRVSVGLAEDNYPTYLALLGYCDLPTQWRCRLTCPQQQNSSSSTKPLPVWTVLHRASHRCVYSNDGSPGHSFSLLLLLFSPLIAVFFYLLIFWIDDLHCKLSKKWGNYHKGLNLTFKNFLFKFKCTCLTWVY